MRLTPNPGPLRRMLRSRLPAASTALLAVSLIASAGTGTVATSQLQGLLDENWRGLYDLIVTAPGTEAELAGLIGPSALDSLETRMTLADLDAVRGVEGVEVAAPLGAITVGVENPSNRLLLAAPITPGDTTEERQGYRLTLTFTTDDGLGERVVSESRVGVSFDDADLPTQTPMTAEEVAGMGDVTCYEDGVAYTEPSPDAPGCFMNVRIPLEIVGPRNLGGGSETMADGHVFAAVNAVPVQPPTITLVDPAAESALLGDAAAFLQPLADLGHEDQSFETLSEHFAAAPNDRTGHIQHRFAEYQDYLNDITGPDGELLLEHESMHFDWGVKPVFPIITSAPQQGTMQLSLTIESGFDPAGDDPRDLPREVFDGEGGTLVHEATLDASGLLDPFGTDALVVQLHGDTPPEALPELMTPQPIIRPSGWTVSGALPFVAQGDGVAISAEEYLEPQLEWDHAGIEAFSPLADGTGLGSEAMFKRIVDQFTDQAYSADGMALIVPVADFDAGAIVIDDSSLGYAPLGSFDTVDTVLIADAEGNPAGQVELVPPTTGFGLTAPVPTVVGDIGRASLLEIEDPISSIRVRVAGIEGGYSPQNIQRVTEVGQRLVDAGFTVTMAAGSSRQDVPIQVGGWAFGIDPAQFTANPAAVQTVGSLGTVEQRWPSIGAAQRVEAAVATSTVAVLALAIGAATLLFGVVQLAGIGPRRRDAALLARLGWRRSRIRRRFAAEDAVALGTLAVAGLGAIALMATQTIGSVDRATPWIVGAALVTAALVSGAALAASVPASATKHQAAGRARRASAAPRALARTTVGFGIGQARLHLGHALTVLVSLTLIGLATAGAYTVVLQGVAAAGQTDLGDASSAQAVIVQAALAVIGIVSGVVLVILARRLDARLRAGQWRALHAMGWSPRRIWRARATELVTVGIPAIVVAAAAAWFGAPLAPDASPFTLAVIAAAASALAVVILLLLQRTDSTAARPARRAARKAAS